MSVVPGWRHTHSTLRLKHKPCVRKVKNLLYALPRLSPAVFYCEILVGHVESGLGHSVPVPSSKSVVRNRADSAIIIFSLIVQKCLLESDLADM